MAEALGTAGSPAEAAAPCPASWWEAFAASTAQAWVDLRYWLALNFCPAEDTPLIEAFEYYCDCLPRGSELTTGQRLELIQAMRRSVHEAVADMYARQQEQGRQRRFARAPSADLALPLLHDEAAAGVGPAGLPPRRPQLAARGGTGRDVSGAAPAGAHAASAPPAGADEGSGDVEAQPSPAARKSAAWVSRQNARRDSGAAADQRPPQGGGAGGGSAAPADGLEALPV